MKVIFYICLFIFFINISSRDFIYANLECEIKGGFAFYQFHLLHYTIGGRLYFNINKYIKIGVESKFGFNLGKYSRDYNFYVGPDIEFSFFIDEKPLFDPFFRFSSGYNFYKTTITTDSKKTYTSNNFYFQPSFGVNIGPKDSPIMPFVEYGILFNYMRFIFDDSDNHKFFTYFTLEGGIRF